MTLYNLKHLKASDTTFSLQNDEGLCLFSLVKILNPKVIVEFGFYHGFSVKNFLAAMSKDSYLYSYDPDISSRTFAKKIKDKRFTFINKRGEDFDIHDLGHGQIDLVLIDASHEFSSNMKLFTSIKKFLSATCIIAVHDTGLFNEDLKKVKWTTLQGFLVGRGYAHQPQERIFVNFLHSRFPEYQQIHLHSMRIGRMGMTLLQKYQNLDNSGIEKFIVYKYLYRKYRNKLSTIIKGFFKIFNHTAK